MKLLALALAAPMLAVSAMTVRADPVNSWPNIEVTGNRTTDDYFSSVHLNIGIGPSNVYTDSYGHVLNVAYDPNFPGDGVPLYGWPMCGRWDIDHFKREFVLKVAGVDPLIRPKLCEELWKRLRGPMVCNVSGSIHACGTDLLSGDFYWTFSTAHSCSRKNVIQVWNDQIEGKYPALGKMACFVGQRQTGLLGQDSTQDVTTEASNAKGL